MKITSLFVIKLTKLIYVGLVIVFQGTSFQGNKLPVTEQVFLEQLH